MEVIPVLRRDIRICLTESEAKILQDVIEGIDYNEVVTEFCDRLSTALERVSKATTK